MASDDITVEILKGIRDEVRGVRIEVKATNERLDATNRRLDVVAERVDLVAERVELVGERVDVLSTTLLGFTAEQRSVTRDLEKRVSKLESAVPGSK